MLMCKYANMLMCKHANIKAVMQSCSRAVVQSHSCRVFGLYYSAFLVQNYFTSNNTEQGKPNIELRRRCSL